MSGELIQVTGAAGVARLRNKIISYGSVDDPDDWVREVYLFSGAIEPFGEGRWTLERNAPENRPVTSDDTRI